MEDELLDLAFAFTERLDIIIALGDASANEYIKGATTETELLACVLELMGILNTGYIFL